MGKQIKKRQGRKGRRDKRFKGKACLYLENTPFGNVVFLEQDRRSNFHLAFHPILENNNFIQQNVRKAIMEPDKVFWSNTRYGSLVIYKYEGPVENPLKSQYDKLYTIVVLDLRNRLGRINPRKIQTAWQIDRIKETKRVYPKNGSYAQY